MVSFGKLFGSVIGPSKGGSAIGFYSQLGYDTLKALFPGKGRRGQPGEAGYQSVEPETSSGSAINVLAHREQVPAVVGVMRASPRALIPAYTIVTEGGDVDTYQIFGYQGRTKWEEIRINDTPTGSFESDIVETETKEGADGDSNLTLVTKSIFREVLNEELPNYKVANVSTNLLQDQTTPANSVSKSVTHTTKAAARKIFIDFVMPNGLILGASGGENTTALHIRIRELGESTWRNLPEMRLKRANGNKATFRLILDFSADPGSLNAPDPTNNTFPAKVFNRCTTNTPNAYNAQWDADPWFGTYETVFVTTSNTEHVDASEHVCTVYLDPDDATDPWPIGQYEIDIRRGWGGAGSGTQAFNRNYTQYFEIVSSSGWRVNDASSSRDSTEQSVIILDSISTYRDEYPIAAANYALLAVRLRNLSINSVSAKVSGYTNNWDGADWDTVEVTSNPAAWARRLYTETYLAYPMPDAVRDDTDFQAWHDECETEGLTCNMVVENGMTIRNLFSILCEAGYAKPRNGATRGVLLDNDRSGDAITGIFTLVNSANLNVSKPFDEIPEALLIDWPDSTDEYRKGEPRVRYRTGFSASTANLKRQSLVAPGKVTSADVDEWGDRKLAELESRTMVFSVTADWEAVQYETGDLVGVAFDTLDIRHHAAVIRGITTSGGNVTGLELEGELHVSRARQNLWETADPWSVVDAWQFEADVYVGIRQSDGVFLEKQITGELNTDSITFTTPFTTPANLVVGDIVWSGPSGNTHRRCLINSIEYQSDMEARVTLVDEAPGIHP